MSAWVIGGDVGGTHVELGLCDPSGAVVETVRLPGGDAMADEAALVAALAAAVAPWVAERGAAALGLGVAGVLDAAAGVITQSPNYPRWRDFALRARLAEAGVGVPIALDNDANAAALGEAAFGAASGAPSFVMLTLGTGVGGAIQLGGRLWRGERGMAAELGHLHLVPDGRPCGCGSRGCLEQYASLVGLRQDVLEHALEIDGAEDLALDPDLPRHLAVLARHGHTAAQAIWDRFGFWLGWGLSSVLNALDVRLVVLGGGIAGALPLFEAAMRETIAANTFPAVAAGLEVRASTLGGRAAVLGGAALAREALSASR